MNKNSLKEEEQQEQQSCMCNIFKSEPSCMCIRNSVTDVYGFKRTSYLSGKYVIFLWFSDQNR